MISFLYNYILGGNIMEERLLEAYVGEKSEKIINDKINLITNL